MTARRSKQAHFQTKLRLIERRVKFKDVAKALGKDASVVSKALNHGCFPRVLQKIKETYDV